MKSSKYKLLKNLEQTYCSFGVSKIHGIGVIAIRDIPKDINPFPSTYTEKAVILTDKELNELPKEVITKVKHIFIKYNNVYSIYNLGLNSMGVRFHLNHSKKPNVGVNIEIITKPGYYLPFVTLKDIKKGEELCCDFTTFGGDDLLNQFKFIKND